MDGSLDGSKKKKKIAQQFTCDQNMVNWVVLGGCRGMCKGTNPLARLFRGGKEGGMLMGFSANFTCMHRMFFFLLGVQPKIQIEEMRAGLDNYPPNLEASDCSQLIGGSIVGEIYP